MSIYSLMMIYNFARYINFHWGTLPVFFWIKRTRTALLFSWPKFLVLAVSLKGVPEFRVAIAEWRQCTGEAPVKQTNRRLVRFLKLMWQCVKTNSTPVVNIKIAGKWMFIPLKMVLIGIDPYPCYWVKLLQSAHGHWKIMSHEIRISHVYVKQHSGWISLQ